MDCEFDIFEKLPDGSAHWHGSIVGVREVAARLTELVHNSKNEFFVFHLSTRTVVARANCTERMFASRPKRKRPVPRNFCRGCRDVVSAAIVDDQ